MGIGQGEGTKHSEVCTSPWGCLAPPDPQRETPRLRHPSRGAQSGGPWTLGHRVRRLGRDIPGDQGSGRLVFQENKAAPGHLENPGWQMGSGVA